jgi:hypothetical protein
MTLSWDKFESLVLQWVFEHNRASARSRSVTRPHGAPSSGGKMPGFVARASAATRMQSLPGSLGGARGSWLWRPTGHSGVAGVRPLCSCTETIGYQAWFGVRPTADGPRLLGEWPPDDGASVKGAPSAPER